MKKLSLIVSLILFLFSTNAQITFQKTYGAGSDKSGYSVQQTLDGGYIVAGNSKASASGSLDVYLMKADVNGNLIWTKTFGGIGGDASSSVQQTTDGGYIIAGQTNSFGAGNNDVYLIKTDANGDSLWTKTFGGTGLDVGYSVHQTTDGGYIVNGFTNSFGAGSHDFYLIKTDANGNSIWTKAIGGVDNDVSNSVWQTTDGGYITTGFTNSLGAGNNDVYLIKTDTNGNSQWTNARTFGGIDDERGNAIQQTTDGGYIIVGYTHSFGAGGADVYLIKTDSAGNSLWTKTFGGVDYDVGSSVQQTTDGGFIITGFTRSFGAGNADIYLIKTDSNGDSLWTRTFGGADIEGGNSVQQTADGGYIITGVTDSIVSGTNLVYLIKTDANGNSGCNQGNPATITGTPATQVTNPAIIVTSPATIVTSPATVVGSGGIVNTLCISVGVNEITTDNLFFISPNPSTGNFIISFERIIINGKVEILNILGENIYAVNILNQSKKEINLKNISAGIYFVKVYDGENSYCKKLIVE